MAWYRAMLHSARCRTTGGTFAKASASEVFGRFTREALNFLRWVSTATSRALLLDVDGTIAPFCDDRNALSITIGPRPVGCCAARIKNDEPLILGEFAGAAFHVHGGALLVNPYHTRETRS